MAYFQMKHWLALFALLVAGNVFAQSPPTAENTESLAQKANDPTAALMSFQLFDWYTGDFYGLNDSANQLLFRAAIPFALGPTRHIFRVTQPFVTDSPGGADGLVDTTVFDLMTFDRTWGRFGVGVVAIFPTGAQGLTTDKWSAGPAVGFVNSSSKKRTWGLFVQTAFSYAGKDNAPDVGFINLQPIFSYPLGKGRSFSLGNSALVYDTEKSKWTSLQLALNYGQVIKFAGHNWKPSIEAGYDFQDAVGNAQWVIRIGFALLLPK